MGLADNTDNIKTSPNFIDSLFASKKANTKNFSLCMGTNGGYLTFGGYNVNKHIANETPQTVPYFENYMIQIENISINNGKNTVLQKPLFAMLDSGTTETYLRSDIFNKIQTQFTSFCNLQELNVLARCGKNPTF